MAGAEEFCKNYLVIDAKEASLYDIACILICSTEFLNKKRFYNEQSDDIEKSTWTNLRRRWTIFTSVAMQKLLIWTKKPLAWTGSLIETWLNLLSSNGGFFRLMINLIRGYCHFFMFLCSLRTSKGVANCGFRDLFLGVMPACLPSHSDSSDGHVVMVLIGVLVGKLVKPEESPEKFTSMIGELDKRLKLDASIRKGDGRYNPSLAMMASKLSYENEAFVKAAVEDHLKMEHIGFYKFWNDYQNQFTTHASMFQDASDPNLIVVAFRGTSPFDAIDWMTDMDLSWYELKDMNNSKSIGRIHSGFMKALGLQKIKGWPKELEPPPVPNEEHPFAYYKIREKLREMLGKNPNVEFIVTGHSLGGALAILFAGVLGLHEEAWLLKRLQGVYTFGQPRVGDECFGRYMMKMIKDHDVRYFRYVYSNDIVPRLPFDDKALFFTHFGPSLYYNSFYDGKVMEEEPNKNYFSLVWVIPKYLNAIWEVIRGFILPYWKGEEYKEEITEKLFRVVGLIVPGLAAHGPKDYVDITRLGTELVPAILTDDEQAVQKND